MGKVDTAQVARRLFMMLFAALLAFSLVPGAAFADEDEGSSDTSSELIAADRSDGVYYGSGEGYQSTITVAVTVKDHRITDVRIVSHADDAAYVARAEKLIDSIIDQQTADVDTISGVTFSSRGIISAVKDAMTGSGSMAITSSIWFSVGMIVLAVALFAGAVVCARRWLAAKTRAEKRKANRAQQWFVQGMFFLLAPSSFATGFMGLKTLFMQFYIMNTRRGYDFEIMSFTILLIILVVLTVIFGRFFCGYVCGFGFLGDAAYKLSSTVAKKMGKQPPHLPVAATKVLRFLKYVVLVAVCALVASGFYSDVNANSPWTVFGKLANLSVANVTAIGAVLLGLIVVGMLTEERFFCRFLCPLGAIYSILPTLPTGRMKRQRPKCRKNCAACQKACPVDIEPKGGLLAGECVTCGRCAEVCPQQNVTCGLEVRADELPEAAEGEAPKLTTAQLLLTRPVSVLWKAALFLLILWLMAVTRFLPTIGM